MATRHLAFTLGTALAVGACGSPKLAQTSGSVTLPESSVAFGPTYVGYPRHRTLSVENSSPADLPLQLSVAAPFSAPTTIVLGGGQVLALDLSFAPSVAGLATGTLTIEGDHVHLVATLTGEGQQPPDCGPPSPCSSVAFDADAGACVDTALPDGSDCASSELCLDHPVCRAGACVGSSLSCDDHDVCTTDACSATTGCAHVAIACPAPSDPCHVAACDPSSGCSTQSAQDGTVCGSVDCATAHICLLGNCVEVTPPDGTECAPASACRAEGTCQSGTCAIPDAGTMTPVWSYALDGGGQLAFNGTIDPDGDLYWIECVTSCQLVSATRDGYLRYRAPLMGTVSAPALVYGNGASFGLFDDVIVIVTIEGAVEAHQADTGALLWSDPIASLVSDGGSPGSWQIGALVGGTTGTVQVIATPETSSGPGEVQISSVRLQLDVHQGVLLGLEGYPSSLGVAIGDEHGIIWASGWFTPPDGGDGTSSEIVALNPDGPITTVPSATNDRPTAAYAGWVFVDGPNTQPLGTVVGGGPVDGSQLFATNDAYADELDYTSDLGGATPVFDGQTGFVFSSGQDYNTACQTCDTPAYFGPLVAGFDPDAGAITWTLPVPTDEWNGFYGPILTNRSTVLVGTAPMPLFEGDANRPAPHLTPDTPVSGASLLEIDAQGNVLSTCPLPGTYAYQVGLSGAALSNGRWFVSRYPDGTTATIEAYDVPGVDVAPHGWVCNGGNPARTGRPW